ncbi:MAG: bifunctional precorrin-2 dehydrogenase/sirohydrochlorin ferrochelatase [Synergistaceae bacterium]|nr:bifunctional precorrin-2 dehydrogenase/sirohydrochlorin ferrochelatase [Synergistaceae bacterium]
MIIINRPPYFPMMIDLQGKPVLIVGGGKTASRRAHTLLRCGAVIHAVSPDFSPDFPQDSHRLTRPFSPTDIHPALALVIAATNTRTVNRLVHDTAQALRIPVNVCDSQTECDFFFPSLINCDNVAASVCTAGLSPTLTRKLSDRLRKVWYSWVSEAR